MYIVLKTFAIMFPIKSFGSQLKGKGTPFKRPQSENANVPCVLARRVQNRLPYEPMGAFDISPLNSIPELHAVRLVHGVFRAGADWLGKRGDYAIQGERAQLLADIAYQRCT